ncbi:hypothetical protein Ancab_035796 [Ancistrocladus abbreviatus]
MAAQDVLLLGTIVISSLVAVCYGDVINFADLQRTIYVSASPHQGQVLKAGVDQITVTWGLNQSLTAGSVDSVYKTTKLKLCYAPISQKDRPWRKTVNDNLAKDKTCQFIIVSRPYTPSISTFNWTVTKDIPTAVYFVRAYAFNAQSKEVAYGQTTDATKSANLFQVQGISGRHASIDIASGVFSAFSLVSLAFFFYWEKRKAKKVTQAN